MDCPRCGAAMNHHADKAVEPLTEDDLALVDPSFGAVIARAYHCPACGHDEFRAAAPRTNP